MKKEKTIRSYKRKTKSGKVVTVKQHTAKYDAAEEMKKALAKKGAGEELASKKLTASEMKQVKDIVEENSELDEQYVAAFYPELSPRMVKAVMAEYRKKSATPKAKAANTAGKTSKPKAEKSSAPDLGFTADEYKAWYHWDTENDPKNKAAMKVKKALLGAMGPRAYKKYEEDMTNSYSSKGHSKAYGTLPELVQARKDARNARLMEGTAKAQKAIAENYGAKEAAAKHDERAKAEGAKRKRANARIRELRMREERADRAKYGKTVAHANGDSTIKWGVKKVSPVVEDVAFTKKLEGKTYSEVFPKGGSYKFFYGEHKGTDGKIHRQLYAQKGKSISPVEDVEPSRSLAQALNPKKK